MEASATSVVCVFLRQWNLRLLYSQRKNCVRIYDARDPIYNPCVAAQSRFYLKKK